MKKTPVDRFWMNTSSMIDYAVHVVDSLLEHYSFVEEVKMENLDVLKSTPKEGDRDMFFQRYIAETSKFVAVNVDEYVWQYPDVQGEDQSLKKTVISENEMYQKLNKKLKKQVIKLIMDKSKIDLFHLRMMGTITRMNAELNKRLILSNLLIEQLTVFWIMTVNV